MSDYAPNQNWETGGSPTNSYNRDSALGDTITIDAGNVTPRNLAITDPGQLGQGNVPGLHFADSRSGDPHATVPYPAEGTFPFAREARMFRRPKPMTYDPYIYKPQDEEHPTDTAPRVGSGAGGAWGSSGAPFSQGVVEEHGPTTAEALAKVAKPAGATAKRSWWRRLAMLPNGPMDDKGAFPQNVVEAMGKSHIEDDAYRAATGAIGMGNTFIIPDIRRQFDDPEDASITVDINGIRMAPEKAGYGLTATPLEGQPWDVQTSHTVPINPFKADPSTWIGPNRVRAGVAEDGQGRPSRAPHWFYFSAVDKWAAEHAYGVKGQVAQPLISRPIYTQSESSMVDEGSAGGPRYYAPAPGMEAVGISPNLARQTPQPWDSNIVTPFADTFNDGMGRVAAAANAGWRAR